MTIDPSELDKLIQDAGLGSRTANRLRRANSSTETTDAASSQPSGHGAPAPAPVQIDNL